MRLSSSHVLGFGLLLAACGDPNAGSGPSGPRLALSGSGGASASSTPLPCDVAAVLNRVCTDCHQHDAANRLYGAPMGLVTWEDLRAAAPKMQMPTYQAVQSRIHDRTMPPASWPQQPTQADADVIDAWVARGAPAGDGSACAGVPPVGGGGTGGTGGGGTGGTGGTIIGPSPTPDGGAPVFPPGDEPVVPDPSECQYLDFHARDSATAASFTVPAGEQYYMFTYHIPNFEAGAQALSFEPVIDNQSVIHHWLLYATATVQTDGTNYAMLGTHPDGTLLAGWAPGAGGWYMPSHVGMSLGAGDFILEVHYNNRGAQAQDHSGVRVCKALTHRPDTASISWLGDTTSIPAVSAFVIPPGAQNYNYTVPCHPKSPAPVIHVMTTWPHMHLLGRHMAAKVHRTDGSTADLLNVDVDFNAQIQYSTPMILNPGDWIENTCTWTNNTAAPVGWGESTTQEMCLDFVAAYPAHALENGLSPQTATPCNN